VHTASTSKGSRVIAVRAWNNFRRLLPSGHRCCATCTFAFAIGREESGTRGDGYVCPQGIHSIQRDGSTSPVRVCGSAAIDCRIVSLSIHPDHEAYSDPKADSVLSFKRQAMYWLSFVRVTPARCHVLCSLSYAQTKAAQDRKQQSTCMTRSTMRGLWRYKATRARARETLGGDTRLVKPGTGPTLFGNGCRDLGEAPRGCQDARANQLFWPMVRLV
jgi:hypothetical protein